MSIIVTTKALTEIATEVLVTTKAVVEIIILVLAVVKAIDTDRKNLYIIST